MKQRQTIVCHSIVCRLMVAMQNIEVAFGKVVRKRRLELGLSQEDFADKAGIHRTYVSSIELGKVQVSIRIAEQLVQALRTSLSRIWKQVESDRD